MLLLLPSGKEETAKNQQQTETFDRLAMQKEMESILRTIDGAGELKLMLTVESGTKQELAQDFSQSSDGTNRTEKKETIVLGAGSGTQEVIVTSSVYPRYIGAVIVCEGAGSAAVRLNIINAVSALTGLQSDQISVIKGEP